MEKLTREGKGKNREKLRLHEPEATSKLRVLLADNFEDPLAKFFIGHLYNAVLRFLRLKRGCEAARPSVKNGGVFNPILTLA